MKFAILIQQKMKTRNQLIFLVALFCIATSAFSQVLTLTNIRPPAPPWSLGWDINGVPGSLEIRNDFAVGIGNDINFFTGGATPPFQRMTVLGSLPAATAGFVGIGIAAPSELLQVLGGNIDVNSIASSYMINSIPVLRHSGTISSIYVGVGAGGTATGLNTCVGWNAGNGITGGGSNVTIGDRAGLVLANSGGNTFVGHEAGMAQGSIGGENTFIGSFAGAGNLSGSGNTYVGEQAGRACTVNGGNTMVGTGAGIVNQAANNTFFGSAAGQNNVGGTNNTFVGVGSVIANITGNNTTALGARAGNISLADFNTFLGSGSNVGVNTVTNGTAVGANAIIPAPNQLILGDRVVNVGIGLSGDNVGPGPQKSLEINADPANFTYTGTNGSGLRFRQLTTSNTPIDNPGDAVLAVSSQGDVVYVKSVGNYCGATNTLPLIADYEIPLDQYDFYFSGQGLGVTNVIVGNTCGNTTPYAKLQSYQLTDQTNPPNNESNAGLFYNGTNDKFAIGGVGISDASEHTNIGLKGIVQEERGINNFGVLGTTLNGAAVLGGLMNVGVYGLAQIPSHPTSVFTNYGVIGDLGIPCPLCIAPVGCPACFGPTAPHYAGYFNGDVFSSTGFYNISDANLKDNIQDLASPLDVIMQLNPKSYTFKQDQNRSMYLGAGTHFGLLAQDLETILPSLVKEGRHPARFDSLGNEVFASIDFKSVNTTELIPFLVGAIKEQQETILLMQGEIANLSGGGNRQNNHGGNEGEEGSSIDVELKNAKSIILNQNVPNPFAEQTTITYFLTDDVKKAQIFFYDNKGIILKMVDINDKGAGQLNVYAADLSSGNYTYTLVADGKVIDTKKMVKTN